MNISFDKYHTYDEIRAFLQDCIREYPELCRVECIGKSYQDREILMFEITNRKTGPGSDKPGIYTDANTHAGEVTGAEVVLYTIKMLLEGYGKDPRITNLIDTRVFYFIPRITVDGSEYYLSTPYMLRSSLRPWPEETDDKPGLYAEDVDGDGRILQMRVKNPDGAWKVSKKDPRVMVRRRPDDLGSPDEVYYDLYTEGLVRDYDPDVSLNTVPSKYRLDFNRQFPTNWALPVRQPGSGDYPFAEPEMKAIGDFILAHPNIVSTMCYHTSGGVLLRPLCDKPDRSLDSRDLAIYRALGEIGEEVTGYPLKSVFESFTWDPERPAVGSDLEWAYETLGILAFETELWDMQGRAGIRKRSMNEMRTLSEKDREEDAVKLLKWNDEEMGGALFHDWKPFNHPQLGEVEIGGWEPKMGRQNPPVSLLEDECKRNAQFTISRAAVTPHLVIEKFAAEALGDELYKVEAVVKNDGYLPTHVTYQALKVKQAQPVKVSLCGDTLVSGKETQEIGHLGGRSGGGDTKKKLTWVVRAEKGTKIAVTAVSPRAGKARAELVAG